MKLIAVKNGLYTMVDDEDYDYLNQFKWRARMSKKRGNTYYVSRAFRIGERKLEKKKQVLMHREILGLLNSKDLCDHVDHNGLNNQRGNLRKCTVTENNRNRNSQSNVSSKYLGVSRHDNKRNKYWVSSVKGKVVGRFPFTKEGEFLAAIKYDEIAKIIFGEFCNPNFK